MVPRTLTGTPATRWSRQRTTASHCKEPALIYQYINRCMYCWMALQWPILMRNQLKHTTITIITSPLIWSTATRRQKSHPEIVTIVSPAAHRWVGDSLASAIWRTTPAVPVEIYRALALSRQFVRSRLKSSVACCGQIDPSTIKVKFEIEQEEFRS